MYIGSRGLLGSPQALAGPHPRQSSGLGAGGRQEWQLLTTTLPCLPPGTEHDGSAWPQRCQASICTLPAPRTAAHCCIRHREAGPGSPGDTAGCCSWPFHSSLRAAQHLPSGSMEHVFYLKKTRNKTHVTAWADAARGKGLGTPVALCEPGAPVHLTTSRQQATYRAMVPHGSLHFPCSLWTVLYFSPQGQVQE